MRILGCYWGRDKKTGKGVLIRKNYENMKMFKKAKAGLWKKRRIKLTKYGEISY